MECVWPCNKYVPPQLVLRLILYIVGGVLQFTTMGGDILWDQDS